MFGAQAAVIFVNTHPDWRRRGVGQAMTAAVLRAHAAGARQACLDANDSALPIYRRLGFETVTVVAYRSRSSRRDDAVSRSRLTGM